MAKPGQVPLDGFQAIRRVGAAKPSPDGARVAFTVTRVDLGENRYHSELWLYERASGEARAFTSGPADQSPVWSPDGQSLAFLGLRGGDEEPQVYVLRVSGGEARRASKGLKGAGGLAFRPDGAAVAVIAWKDEQEEGTDDLWQALDAAGALPKDGARTQDVLMSARLKYRADGVGYANDRRRHLAEVALADEPQEARWLTAGAFDVMAAAWHPDAGRIAFVRGHTGRLDEFWDTAVYEADARSGGEPRRIAYPGGRVSGIAWSPLGDRLAVVAEDQSAGVATDQALWLCDPAGGELRRLLQDLDRPIGPGLFGDSSGFPEGADIAWDEDGQGLAVQVQDEGVVYPVHVDLADQAHRRLLPESFRGSCASLRLAGDAYWSVMETSAEAAEVYEIPRAGGEALRRTDLNLKALAAWGAQPLEEIRYASPDGTQVHAFVAKPADFAPGRRYPLVLMVHGGPHGMFGHAFEHETLLNTSEGRIVLMVNPRGSLGYGQAFTAGCVNDWGGGDYQDIMAGVDALIARGWVDPGRMAVNGISYGGYMSSWILTHTDRFACAIPEMLVSDLVSMWGTSDIGWFLMEGQAGGTPLDGGRGLWAHSPLAYAHQAKTPTLIIEGENDHRCPIGQGEELYTALRRQGVEAVLVRLQGVSHVAAWMGPPRLRLARKALIQRFLLRHGVGGDAAR